MVSLGNFRLDAYRRSPKFGLDADEMLSAALSGAGRQAYRDDSFAAALRKLVHAYNTEADLSAFGRYSARFDVLRCLKNLLQFDAVEERDASITERPIHRPVFITGLPRSGTTFLHNLLAQDSGIATPLSWQLVYPYPSRHPFGIDPRARIVELQFRVIQFLSPELRELHPLSAQEPQECTDITAQVFQSLRFDSLYRIPSYQDWLERRGHFDAYRFHRRFLQHLDAQAPGRRWVLKSPDHIFALDAIRAVYPDAHIVFLHRDPLNVLASVAKLTEVLRRPFTNQIDRIAIGRQVSASWTDGAERMMTAAVSDPSILHLHYRDVVDDPMGAAARLYRHCGISLSAESERHMRGWLRKRSQSPNGRKRYNLADFGLDEKLLRDQFEGYSRAFDVPPEWPGAGHAHQFA